jgi:hypothetical protein
LLLLFTLACEEAATVTPGAPTPTPGAYPPLVLDTGHQATIEAAQVERYLEAIEAEDTLRQYHAEATATAEAYLYEQWEATATAEARRFEATATAEAVRFDATATAWAVEGEARRAAATATAIAQATQEARAAAAWAGTATAEAVRFEQTATAQAGAIEATATATTHRAAREAAESAAAARRAELEAKREELVYPLKAYGPWALAFVALVLFVYGAIRLIGAAEVQARVIRRDARGDAPVLVLRNANGRPVVYDPDRAFGPAAIIDADVTMPALTEEGQQAAVTMRDQAVDLATRGLPRPDGRGGGGQSQGQRRRAAGKLALTGAPPQVKVIPPATVAGWLRDVRPQALALTLDEDEVN